MVSVATSIAGAFTPMAQVTSIRGFKDIVPDEVGKWHYVEARARSVFSLFGIREIRIPILEKTELFIRGIGETTDIVEKEMYTFKDRGEDLLTLRPEATASVLRACIEHHLYETDPLVKLFTIGPMFRRERPQKGRFRQFHQINVEYIGQDDPRIDAELIFMLMYLLQSLGLENLNLEINSLGCAQCRKPYRPKLVAYLRNHDGELCQDCLRRLETNPLRIFDCKAESCQKILVDAPVMLDTLCHPCRHHFDTVQQYLGELSIHFTLNTRMVRGLDYYTKTAFEVTAQSLGAQNAVTGGGRYDGLVKLLGGPDMPGVGFAIGVERLISMIPRSDEDFIEYPDIFIAALGARAQGYAFLLAQALRRAGIKTEMDYSPRSLKGLMKRSDRLHCRYTLIVGDDELDAKKASLRNMTTKEQAALHLSSVEEDARSLASMINGNNMKPADASG